MNLNSCVLNKRAKMSPRARNVVMPPPKCPAPKKRDSTPSSHLSWGLSVGSKTMNISTNTELTMEMEEARVLMALTEGRGYARCEIGIAIIDLSHPKLILCQISDTSSYVNTLTTININHPTDILVPATFLENESNRFIDIVKRQFSENTIRFINLPRKLFNKQNGWERIQQLCLPEFKTILVGLQHRHYALAAAAALLSFLQNNLYVFYVNQSIKVVYQEAKGFAVIDVSTADRLELVASTKPTQANRYSSLFGILNHCFTRLGTRSLRSAILQPPFALPLIKERLNCVTELLKKPEKLLPIQATLQKISNIGQLLTITNVLASYSYEKSNKQLNYLLLLNNLVDMVEPLGEILDGLKQPFFVQLRALLIDENFVQIKEILRNQINSNARLGKGQDALMQRAFAIKSGINGLLDLVRKTYSERLDEMRQYVKNLSQKYKLAFTLGNNNTKGYHLILRFNKHQKMFMKKTDIPPEFIQVYSIANGYTMKTLDLVNLSTRIGDLMSDIIHISNKMVYDLLIEIKQYIGLFYYLCEWIGKLDMLQSLAQASAQNYYTCPKFGDLTELTNAHHPLLDFVCENQPIPNNISISKCFNIQIITGPNGSGKSIYIRQVLLLQIMAQIGCYVPASNATFRPADRMFARICLDDNMEMGASTFVLEMKEIKYMMTIMTSNSLFVIDEICRSTSLEEGTALAVALCENLAKTPAFILITTHYTLLTRLYDLYLNVKIWQMETIANGTDPKTMTLDYKYNLIPGLTTIEGYGIYLVRNVWPDGIIQRIDRTLEFIQLNNSNNNKGNFAKIDAKIRLKYKLVAQLKQLKIQNKLTEMELNKYLDEYVNNLKEFGVKLDKINIQGCGKDPDAKSHNTGPELNDFTPESIKQQHFKPINLSSESNSRNTTFENFINENPENIDKLIPEVIINSRNSPLEISRNSNESDEYFTPVNSQLELNDNNNIKIYGKINESQYESIIDDLNSFNESLINDDKEFSEMERKVIEKNEEKPIHLFPIVKILVGPDNPSFSFGSENDNDESINYSPIRTESDENSKQSEENVSSHIMQPLQVNSSTERIELELSDENRTSTESKRKSEDSNESVNKLTKFAVPKKLTLKEIKEEYRRQDNEIYEKSVKSPKSSEKLLKLLINRPSIKQVQKSRHLLTVRRNDNGIDVIKPIERAKSAVPMFQRTLSTSIDMTIFSDKNAEIFNEFINSNEKHFDIFKEKKVNSTVGTDEFSAVKQQEFNRNFHLNLMEINDNYDRNSVVNNSQEDSMQRMRRVFSSFSNLSEENCNLSHRGNNLPLGDFHFSKDDIFKPNFNNSAPNSDFVRDNANFNDENLHITSEKQKFAFQPNFEQKTDQNENHFQFTPLSNDRDKNVLDFNEIEELNENDENPQGLPQKFSQFSSLTPDGYYKRNKGNIDNIINKYLNSPSKEENRYFKD